MDISSQFDKEEDSVSEEESDEDIDENCEIIYPGTPREKLIDKDSYVLNISATRSSNPHIAISLSNENIAILDLFEDFVETTTLNHKLGKPVELKFDVNNDDLLWTGTYNGYINLWDLRVPEAPVSSFTDTTADKDRKFNCFDVSSNSKLLCAGTECVEGDSFILFWDIRKTKLAGGFWESHTDDITQVKFHQQDSTKLISGSTDGLINMYDLRQTCEDDALIDTLNTESSIEKLIWSELGSKDIIGCITHTADVQFWKDGDVQPYINLNRKSLAQNLRRSSENYIYLVDLLPTRTGFVILAGSNAKNGQCSRGLKLEMTTVNPAFGLHENKQRIRCSWLNEDINLLLTGGEKGYLNAWRLKG